MSIYGPTLKLPKIKFPKININMEPSKKGLLQASIIITIIAIILLTILFAGNFNQHIQTSWENNPINLKDAQTNAELTINLTNTTEEVKNIFLEVTTESEELLIVCPHTKFDNVEPGNSRKISCIVRRNPNEKIFAGDYTITVKTNLGEAKTNLTVKTK